MKDFRQLILIRGPICAGKSTTVKELRKILPEASVIDFDVFKLMLDNRGSSEWRRQTALKVALFMAHQVALTGRPMIVDVPSSKPELVEAYAEVARAYGYEFSSYLLYPPLQVCLERNENRGVPGALYTLDPALITAFWSETVCIEGEKVFDTSHLAPEEVARQIRESF